MNAATTQRERYFAAMAATDPGARLARRQRIWTIVDRRHQDTSVALTLRHGRRTLRVVVPVCITGPCWADVGLRPVGDGTVQRSLLRAAA